ncbi:MAG: DUF308 domain-containing protein [Candidatus Thorarchaeota archaeon]
MDIYEIIDKNKIRADDYITVLMVISYALFALFFRLEAFLSIIVYPFSALAIFGVLKIINALNRRRSDEGNIINKLLFGTASIIISVFFLNLILIQPNVTLNIIITLISFPLLIVGYAGIIKGLLIDKYSIKHRIVSVFVGIITLVVCLLGLFYVINIFLMNILNLCIVFVLNVLSRAALYLSEYGLSLIRLKNFKLFLYIISDYLIFVDKNGDVLLSKIS